MLKQMIKDEIKERIFGKDEIDKQGKVAMYLAIMLLLVLSVIPYDSPKVTVKSSGSYIPAVMINN